LKFSIPKELLELCKAHAEQRGMSIEEYIEEFIGILNEEKAKGNVAVDSESIRNALSSYSKLQ